MGGVVVKIDEIEKKQKELINMVDTLAQKQNKVFVMSSSLNSAKRPIAKI